MKINIKLVIIYFLFIFSCLHTQAIIKRPNIVWLVSRDVSKHYMKMFDSYGAQTPNIEALAKQGISFINAFCNSPTTSASRSLLISGCYGPKTCSHYNVALEKAPMPEGLKMFPMYLREAGYYCVNDDKDYYNFKIKDNIWDDSSASANWKNRKSGQPFFYVKNLKSTNEKTVHFTKEEMNSNKNIFNKPFVQPNYPDTKLFRYTYNYFCDRVVEMDKEVGLEVKALKDANLLDDTFIFFFSDNGGSLPQSKGYLTEMGLNIPLVVYVPKNYRKSVSFEKSHIEKGFVSFVDFAPTVLKLASVKIPKRMDGKPFLGGWMNNFRLNRSKTTYGYVDRVDESYNMVRSVRFKKYKYIRNYEPFNIDGLVNSYRYKQLAYREWKDLFDQGNLNDVQSKFFKIKQPEELYDLEKDPYEIHNLSDDKKYKSVLKKLRKKEKKWQKENVDLAFYPEYYLIDKAFTNSDLFAKKNKKNISKYKKIANYQLHDFFDVSKKIEKSLNSFDPYERYWALIDCIYFGEKAKSLKDVIILMASNDQLTMNRVRAAEYLGLNEIKNPMPIMLNALYQTESESKALLIMNCIEVINATSSKYFINVMEKSIRKNLLLNKYVKIKAQVVNSKLGMKK